MTKIWQISREYAGLAEAGGVKNVVTSLCEQLVSLDNQVTLFIPLYGCTAVSAVQGFEIVPDMASAITVDGQNYIAFYGNATIPVGGRDSGRSVQVVFVVSSLFTEKMGVYTYTPLEEKLNPEHERGKGHADAPILEMLFQKAVLWYGILKNDIPDIIHCHDATTAMIPVFARNGTDYAAAYKDTEFLVTVHNAGPFYHHEIESVEKAVSLTGLPAEVLSKGLNGSVVEPYLLASECSHLSTVSPWYAEELIDPENSRTDGLSKGFAERGITVTGITNGIDYEKYNPTDVRKSHLISPYNPETLDLAGKYACREDIIAEYREPDTSDRLEILEEGQLARYGYVDTEGAAVWFSYHGRIAGQKGIDVLTAAIPEVLAACPEARFLITGQGESALEKALQDLAERQNGKVLYLRGYNRSMARQCVAAADFIVLPSWFEPCGLEDFIASLLGTVPVAHATGGLRKIEDGVTGYLYEPNQASVLAEKLIALTRSVSADSRQLEQIIQTAARTVHNRYSWEAVVKNQYVPLYGKLLKKK